MPYTGDVDNMNVDFSDDDLTETDDSIQTLEVQMDESMIFVENAGQNDVDPLRVKVEETYIEMSESDHAALHSFLHIPGVQANESNNTPNESMESSAGTFAETISSLSKDGDSSSSSALESGADSCSSNRAILNLHSNFSGAQSACNKNINAQNESGKNSTANATEMANATTTAAAVQTISSLSKHGESTNADPHENDADSCSSNRNENVDICEEDTVSVAAISPNPNESITDVEMILVGDMFPKPIQCNATGLMKRENDPVSGNLPYATKVRNIKYLVFRSNSSVPVA